MSVLIPDLTVYNYVQAGIERLAYTNTIDSLWSEPINQHFRNCQNIEEEAERLVLSWLRMNQDSYNEKYPDLQDNIDLIGLYKASYTHKPLTAIQLLKYMQCIEYNIEIQPRGEQEEKDIELLRSGIIDLMHSITSNMPEYEAAGWCN